MIDVEIDAIARASLKRAMEDKLGEILDFWVRGFLAGLIEGLKMSDEKKDQRIMQAGVCTFRPLIDEPDKPLQAGEWQTGIVVGRISHIPAPSRHDLVIVGLDGKVFEGKIADCRIQWYHGMVTATGRDIDVDPSTLPTQWPTAQDLAGAHVGGNIGGTVVSGFETAQRSQRETDFLLLVQTFALSPERVTAGHVVGAALRFGQYPPDHADLALEAELFVCAGSMGRRIRGHHGSSRSKRPKRSTAVGISGRSAATGSDMRSAVCMICGLWMPDPDHPVALPVIYDLDRPLVSLGPIEFVNGVDDSAGDPPSKDWTHIVVIAGG